METQPASIRIADIQAWDLRERVGLPEVRRPLSTHRPGQMLGMAAADGEEDEGGIHGENEFTTHNLSRNHCTGLGDGEPVFRAVPTANVYEPPGCNPGNDRRIRTQRYRSSSR